VRRTSAVNYQTEQNEVSFSRLLTT